MNLKRFREDTPGLSGGILGDFADRLNPPPERDLTVQEEKWWDALQEARREWEEAQAYFQNVSDPALVDHAVHVLTAAEKKYSYMLARVKREMAGEMGEGNP